MKNTNNKFVKVLVEILGSLNGVRISCGYVEAIIPGDGSNPEVDKAKVVEMVKYNGKILDVFGIRYQSIPDSANEYSRILNFYIPQKGFACLGDDSYKGEINDSPEAIAAFEKNWNFGLYRVTFNADIENFYRIASGRITAVVKIAPPIEGSNDFIEELACEMMSETNWTVDTTFPEELFVVEEIKDDEPIGLSFRSLIGNDIDLYKDCEDEEEGEEDEDY